MKEYDVIIIGSGSAMNIVEPMIEENPRIEIAVIDKDEPGGICLTRGCIPSKILLYPAEVLRTTEQAKELGISAQVTGVDFHAVMARMRSLIDVDIDSIRGGLSSSPNIDYYHEVAEFVAPYTMKVGGETIKGKMFLVASGSAPVIPKIDRLDEIGYITSDDVVHLKERPESLAIIGGGFIAAEYGYFFASMGSRVTIIGRNSQFLPEEEPEISRMVERELRKRLKIVTDHEVVSAGRDDRGMKVLQARDKSSGSVLEVQAAEVLVAAGRGPLSEVLRPGKAGIKTDSYGWIVANEFLETSQPNIWVIGDATGRFMFKHKANYDSQIVYYNAVLKRKVPVDYHAVPHAIFTDPEVASVGMREAEAVAAKGASNVLIGFQRYQDTAKGEAMNARDYFAKIVVDAETSMILGAHIVGPHASVLIQEIIAVMYTNERKVTSIYQAMHIHPALSEVVERAAGSLVPVEHYHHMLKDYGLEP